MKTVIRHYRTPTGEVATLVYEGRPEAHAVRAYRSSEPCVWKCDTIEAARSRWACLQADLTAGGFRPVISGR